MDFEARARDAGVDLDMELTSVGSYEFAIPVGDLLIVAGSIVFWIAA